MEEEFAHNLVVVVAAAADLAAAAAARSVSLCVSAHKYIRLSEARLPQHR